MATVTKRGNSYKITVSCGYDINNKQLRKHTTWTPPAGMTARQIEKELDRQKVLFEEKCRTGQLLDGSIRFSDFVDKWLHDYGEKQLRITTLNEYKHLLKRILPALGHIRLDRLQPHHLQEFYNNLAESGVRADVKQRFKGDFAELLKQHGQTVSQFAALAGISSATVRQIVNSKNVSHSTAEAAAAALGFPVSELFQPIEKQARLTENSIHHYHTLLSSIFSTAVQWQVIYSNPCSRIKPPKIPHKEAVYLDDVQAARLLELLEQLPTDKLDFQTAITMLLFTGLRRSELLGLNWSDIDMESGIVSINQTSKYIPHVGIVDDDTKNSSSRRSFKAPAELLPLLRQYRVWQMQKKLLTGDQWHDSDRVFTSWDGTPMRPDTLTRRFHRWIQTTDLPPVHLHSLRHTNATLLIANGTNIQTVSKRLGHSTSSTTANIYSHAIQSADAAAAEAVSVFTLHKKA